MLTGRKLHVCRWECFSLLWGNKTDGLSFVRVLPVILQRKAQSQQAREFHKKSIKEKGVYLSGLFSEDSSAVLKVTISSSMCAPHPPLTLWPSFCSTCLSQCVYLHMETHHVCDRRFACCLFSPLPSICVLYSYMIFLVTVPDDIIEIATGRERGCLWSYREFELNLNLNSSFTKF